jgi:hypothetical protein
MARANFINAILSGKLAGTVYARNKGGAYVRQWVKPTDPQTVAQLSARANFASSSSSYHSLTDPQKAQWNGFALTNFTPKHPITGVLYSGQQAYNSLRNTALNAIRLTRTAAFTAPAVTATFVSYAPTQTAPVTMFGSAILDSAAKPLNQSLNAATLTAAGNFTATIGFDQTTTTSSPLWNSAVGNQPSGYVFYASNPLMQANMFVTNPELNIVGVVKPPTVSTGWTAVNQFTLSMTAADLPVANHKIWYTTGNIVQITAFACSKNGQLARIGSVKITVT